MSGFGAPVQAKRCCMASATSIRAALPVPKISLPSMTVNHPAKLAERVPGWRPSKSSSTVRTNPPMGARGKERKQNREELSRSLSIGIVVLRFAGPGRLGGGPGLKGLEFRVYAVP
jgi:hypothetical protein